MRHHLSSVAVGAMLAAGLLMGAPTAQAQTQQTERVGDCEIVSAEREREIMAEPERRGAFTGTLSRDLRQMRDAAMQLERYGQTEACEAVADAMREIMEDPEQYRETAQRAGAQPRDTDLTWQERRDQDREQAVDLSERAGALFADDLIGADVRGTDGDSIGEVDNIVLADSLENSFLVVSYGGFLGMGKDLSAIPMDRVRVSRDGDTVYVPLSKEQLENAPTFNRGDQAWLEDKEWRERNRAFYGR